MTDGSPKKYVHAGKTEEVNRLEFQAKIFEPEITRELELMGLKKGMRVLDAGCGTGAITRMIARMVAPGEVHGRDIDPVFIEAAKKFAEEEDFTNIQFDLGNIDNLEFDDDSFDAAYCRLVLMHVKDPVVSVGELRRVTTSGGLIAASDNDDGGVIVYPPIPAAMKAWSKYGEHARTRGEDRYVGRKLFSIFSQAGLRTIEIVPIPQPVTQQDPNLLALFAAVPKQIVEADKEALISKGYLSPREYEEGMKEIQQFPAHPGAFAMSMTFLATGIVP